MTTLGNPGLINHGTMNRAEFIGSIGALALALTTGGCDQIAQEIANRPTRRNLANLTANDPILVTYRNAVSQMQALPASDKFNWAFQAGIHGSACPHGNWWLFPWHSAYLVYFERIIRQLTGDTTWALPYWNWATTNTAPSVFYANNALHDPTEGPTPVTELQEFVGHDVLEGILAETNFELFAGGAATSQRQYVQPGGIEATPHNNVHGSFPGDMSQVPLAGLDPIFWCHHAMVDYCWVDWQFGRGNANTSDPAWANLIFSDFFDQNRQSVNTSVAITPLFAIFDYQYEPSQIGAGVDKIQAIKTHSDANKLKAVVSRGAPSAIQILQRYPLAGTIDVSVATAAVGRIKVGKEALSAALQAGSGQRALLRLQHVEPPAKADVFVRVFVNAPGAVSDKTPISDPHYAGSFAFFLMGDGGDAKMSMVGDFVVDLTPTLRRIGAADALDIQVVAVPYPGREARAQGFKVGGLELDIAKPPAATRQ
jgi:tyrosinase